MSSTEPLTDDALLAIERSLNTYDAHRSRFRSTVVLLVAALRAERAALVMACKLADRRADERDAARASHAESILGWERIHDGHGGVVRRLIAERDAARAEAAELHLELARWRAAYMPTEKPSGEIER